MDTLFTAAEHHSESSSSSTTPISPYNGHSDFGNPNSRILSLGDYFHEERNSRPLFSYRNRLSSFDEPSSSATVLTSEDSSSLENSINYSSRYNRSFGQDCFGGPEKNRKRGTLFHCQSAAMRTEYPLLPESGRFNSNDNLDFFQDSLFSSSAYGCYQPHQSYPQYMPSCDFDTGRIKGLNNSFNLSDSYLLNPANNLLSLDNYYSRANTGVSLGQYSSPECNSNSWSDGYVDGEFAGEPVPATNRARHLSENYFYDEIEYEGTRYTSGSIKQDFSAECPVSRDSITQLMEKQYGQVADEAVCTCHNSSNNNSSKVEVDVMDVKSPLFVDSLPSLKSHAKVVSKKTAEKVAVCCKPGNPDEIDPKVNPRVFSGKKPKKNMDYTRYVIHLNKVMSGEDTRMTIMLKNIPNGFTQEIMIKILNCFAENMFDFFYMPVDFKTNCNLGFGYVSMINKESLMDLYKCLNHKKWPNTPSSKICEVVYARMQGRADMQNLCNDWAIMQLPEKYRPVFFEKCTVKKGGKDVVVMKRVMKNM